MFALKVCQHVGHLRSAIIGEAIANTMEFLGHSVERVSHVGDFGTPLAIVVRRALDLDLAWTRQSADAQLRPTVSELAALYREGKALRDSDAAFATRVDEVLLVLQLQPPPHLDDAQRHRLVAWLSCCCNAAVCCHSIRRTWACVCEVSTRAFDRTFARLGVSARARGESHHVEQLPHVCQLLQVSVRARALGGDVA
jgi:arginyl-tRNA synthetase